MTWRSASNARRAHLAHIFERFNRADASRSRTTLGAGLGLAVVEQLVAAPSGTVSVASDGLALQTADTRQGNSEAPLFTTPATLTFLSLEFLDALRCLAVEQMR